MEATRAEKNMMLIMVWREQGLEERKCLKPSLRCTDFLATTY